MILTLEQNLDFEELLVVQLQLVGKAVKSAVITSIMITYYDNSQVHAKIHIDISKNIIVTFHFFNFVNQVGCLYYPMPISTLLLTVDQLFLT